MTIQELADYARGFFEPKEIHRRNEQPKRIWVLKRRYPTWVKEMVFKAHENMMPDDYKYEYVVDTLDALEEGQDPEEGMYDLEADVYNHQLVEWLASHGERSGFVDEATEHIGHSKDMGIMGDIMMGQKAEKEQVWASVMSSLNERLEAIEAGERETFEVDGNIERGGEIRRWRPGKKK